MINVMNASIKKFFVVLTKVAALTILMAFPESPELKQERRVVLRAANKEVGHAQGPPFLYNQPVFDPETTSAMVEAFLDVSRELNLGSDNQAKEAIAEQILGFAQRGEYDRETLRKMAISAWRAKHIVIDFRRHPVSTRPGNSVPERLMSRAKEKPKEP